MLNDDNTNIGKEAAPEITPSLISNRKEILLDVVELLNKIKDKNVFLDNNHEPIPRSHMLKNHDFQKMINKFTIRKSKKTVQKVLLSRVTCLNSWNSSYQNNSQSIDRSYSDNSYQFDSLMRNGELIRRNGLCFLQQDDH
ncbi:hypothetical protein CEXT_374671 [Caerostris extrusa]|uniref:Ycf1 n=1 Tax=Caerostris extrusa TaxID=172846 RepID=A0AAV4VZJ3_CAEEX|nr:hypothetical protein CEXT_374671 [Caerostris extrusa]